MARIALPSTAYAVELLALTVFPLSSLHLLPPSLAFCSLLESEFLTLLPRSHSNHGSALICNLNLPLDHKGAFVIFIFNPSRFCDCYSTTIY